jgi:hypothetical protein
MTDRTGLARAALLVAAVLAAGGCGPDGPKLYPVAGKVTLKDGTPVKAGHVILHPDAGQGNTSKDVCQGTIQDGAYVIRTGAREGAPPGKYKVVVEAAADVDANSYITAWLADEKYLNTDTSQLNLEVIEKPEPGRYDFNLDPHPRPKKPAVRGAGAKN